MADQEERLGSIIHTLQHTGLSGEQINDFFRSNPEQQAKIANQLRPIMRRSLENQGVRPPDPYVADSPVSQEVVQPPLPASIIGGLAVLGTSESRLSRLEPKVH
jgi:hypothetical protein